MDFRGPITARLIFFIASLPLSTGFVGDWIVASRLLSDPAYQFHAKTCKTKLTESPFTSHHHSLPYHNGNECPSDPSYAGYYHDYSPSNSHDSDISTRLPLQGNKSVNCTDHFPTSGFFISHSGNYSETFHFLFWDYPTEDDDYEGNGDSDTNDYTTTTSKSPSYSSLSTTEIVFFD